MVLDFLQYLSKPVSQTDGSVISAGEQQAVEQVSDRQLVSLVQLGTCTDDPACHFGDFDHGVEVDLVVLVFDYVNAHQSCHHFCQTSNLSTFEFVVPVNELPIAVDAPGDGGELRRLNVFGLLL